MFLSHLFPVACIFLFAAAHTAVKPLPEKVTQIMEQEKYQHANWGILVKDAVTGEVCYEKNSNQLFLPGSTTKLFATAGLIHTFGDDYRFKTPVYAMGSLKEGVFTGDLIIVGQGDLTFGGRQKSGSDTIAFTKMDHIYANMLPDALLTPENPLNALIELAKEIKTKGISRIEGNIIIDDRLFETVELRGLIASPLLINENLIDIVIDPTKVGELAAVHWRPKVEGYTLINECMTIEETDRFEVFISSDDPEGRTIKVSGSIPLNAAEMVRTFPIADPKAFARDAFAQALKEQGISVVSNAQAAKPLPPMSAYSTLKPIAVWTSPPLSEYVKLILKVSHNLGANLIPLLLASKKGETTFEAGLLELGKFIINEVGVPPDAFVLVDGAGGDGNRFTPQAELKLLEYVRRWPKAQFRRYLQGLPILGVDGSLEDFGKNSPAMGKVYAKTGTGIEFNLGADQFFLTTQALTGFIEGKNGHLLEFMAVVNNGNMPNLEDIFPIFDDLCQIPIEFYNLSN